MRRSSRIRNSLIRNSFSSSAFVDFAALPLLPLCTDFKLEFATRRYRRKALRPPLKDTESDDSDSSDSDDDSDEEDAESDEEEVVISSPRSTRSKDTDSGFSQVKLSDFLPSSSCSQLPILLYDAGNLLDLRR